ncbi:histidinol dehydrogenase [Granulosicoccus antarcticus]|uniref:Sulfopropanediol 3-dehydrogenase n=1 Tax=Granulosicoccus antarcticus IMCC3135 TaxID=1192854 RepID=A0A2Z2NXP4_9GAMM|nr:histidinol dehydrogenase [Granulosicoccus antarcticus]ASJ76226.1 Sulfopropanediol 3-dehydrogenase [Granulosicoccus antarcticus IMCC3135]
MEYLKKSDAPVAANDERIQETVKTMLARIEADGESAVREYAAQFDNWQGDFILSDARRAELIARVPEQTRQDIQFAYRQIKGFAEAQRASLTEFEVESAPGVKLGQKIIPVNCAGCYVPGGRYSHAASALMSIATAKVAGVETIVACSPPKDGSINPAIVYAMDLAGADIILEMGGVHAVATMAKGLFTGVSADILVGPGNGYVAEAKRLLFGEVGIDVFAGPTESAIIADDSADPMTIAVDLVSQAEHGYDSPVWLFTTSRRIGEKVAELMPKVAADMPNQEVVQSAWDVHGEIIFCETREECVRISDEYASEHLQVLTQDTDWWLENLKNYGSLFLGEGATVTHGDKCSGTNHILPTKRVARYSGGLNVHKFLKILTYQEISEEANLDFSAVGSRISRVEGMEGHARACDWRLRKYFPEKEWDFPVYDQQHYE